MKNNYFEQFIELLNKKEIVRQIQVAKQLTPDASNYSGVQKAIDRMCVVNAITKALERDAELKKAYDIAANEIMFNKIMDSIDLKKDENFKFTPQELLAKELSKVLFGGAMNDLEKLKDLF